MTAPSCRCSHTRRYHGADRRGRPTCFGSPVCGCSEFRPADDPQRAAKDRHPSGKAIRTDGGPSLLEYLKSKGEA